MLRHKRTKERVFVSHEENEMAYLECDIMVDNLLTGVISIKNEMAYLECDIMVDNLLTGVISINDIEEY